MKSLLSVQKAVLVSATVLLGFTFTSWQEGTVTPHQILKDTVPAPREKKVKDIDDALAELDNATADIEKSIKEINWDKVNADLKESMKNLNVDMKQMNADLKKSLQEIDVEKMRQDVEESVAKIDWDEIKRDIEKAKETNMEDVKKELENVKVELAKLKPEIEKSLRDARKNIEDAKVEMQSYKTFLNGLERDGLINKKEGYKIEHKDGQLRINDKQQPEAVYNKYRSFLEKNKKFTMEKNDDDFNITND